MLARELPEVLIIDLMMPRFSGLDICRTLRTMPQWFDLPIMLITGSSDPSQKLLAYQAGADDFVTKPLEMEEVCTRIQLRVERNRIMQERFERDSLTGLYTRRVFIDQFRTILSKLLRQEVRGVLAILDVDRFKKVNDAHGHGIGDQVLVRLANLLQTRLRQSDLICRWGGEEFVAFLPDSTVDQAERIFTEVLLGFSQLRLFAGTTELTNLTFSAGLSDLPSDGVNLDQLVEHADRRLYAAKNRGRNQIISRLNE